MKTVNFQVSFTGRVDDNYAAALQAAWNQSATVANIPLGEVTLAIAGDKNTLMKFDFCQPESLRIEKPL